MELKRLYVQALAGGLLLLSGCGLINGAPVGPDASGSHASASGLQGASKSSGAGRGGAPVSKAASSTAGKADTSEKEEAQLSASLTGKSEDELRALLGPPTSIVEHAPGKVWRYRDGPCTFDIQLFPDVQTHRFGSLAYEVRNDDHTDEGNRRCLAQLRSRTRSHG